MSAETLGAVLGVDGGADAVALRALGADVRHISGPGAHRRQRHGVVVLFQLRFEYCVGLGIEARPARRTVAIAEPPHLDARIADHLADFIQERLLVFVWMQPHIERRLHFRRDHVVAKSRVDDGGHERGVEHGPVSRLVLEQPFRGRSIDLGIGAQHVTVDPGHLRRNHRLQLAEVGAGRLVDPERRHPVGDLADRRRQVRHGVVLRRH